MPFVLGNSHLTSPIQSAIKRRQYTSQHHTSYFLSAMKTCERVANLALAGLTLAPLVMKVDPNLNVIFTACLTVYVGCHRSVKRTPPTEQVTMSKEHALQFPFVVNAVLLSLFLLFKFLLKDLVNALFTCYYFFLGFIALSVTLLPAIDRFLPKEWNEDAIVWRLPYFRSIETEFTMSQIVAVIPGTFFCAWYASRKHWLANNILVLAVCIQGIEMLSLGSFKTGAILLVEEAWTKPKSMYDSVQGALDKFKELKNEPEVLTEDIRGSNKEKEAVENQRTETLKRLAQIKLDVKELEEKISTHSRAKVEAQRQLKSLNKEIYELTGELDKVRTLHAEQVAEEITKGIIDCERPLSILEQKQGRATQFSIEASRDEWLQKEIGYLERVLPSNFTQGGLFVYEIFCVFFTAVMVSVAKSFDAPIKLLFPTSDSARPFSMLGLDDIVIPGSFVALALRFDVSRGKENRYFRSAFFGYTVGVILTIIVMNWFQAGQPALLYIVPAVIGSVAVCCMRNDEVKLLWEFDESRTAVDSSVGHTTPLQDGESSEGDAKSIKKME